MDRILDWWSDVATLRVLPFEIHPETPPGGAPKPTERELTRALRGDSASGAFHHDVARAFLTQGADISKPEMVNPIARGYGASTSDVDAAWQERRYRHAVDAFIDQARTPEALVGRLRA